jgi:hypothetical protein
MMQKILDRFLSLHKNQKYRQTYIDQYLIYLSTTHCFFFRIEQFNIWSYSNFRSIACDDLILRTHNNILL